MKNTAAYSISGTGKINAVINFRPYSIDQSHKNYTDILDAVKRKDWDEVVRLSDITSTVNKYIESHTASQNVAIKDGCVEYKGNPVHNSLTERILRFMRDGLPFEPMLNLFDNLMLNPSRSTVQDLYSFMEAGELPITEDGHFLAYKNVAADWYSITGNKSIKPIVGTSNDSGHILNNVGEVIEILRSQVEEDRNLTCAPGLHFCTIDYLPSYVHRDGGHTVIVKINPRDVVAIPVDYNNAKGRCCRYEVVAEYDKNFDEVISAGEKGFDHQVYSSENGQIYGFKPTGQKFYNVRDEKGHFIKKS